MDDLISRQEAIDELTHKWDGMVTSVFNVLKELPPAQPEQNVSDGDLISRKAAIESIRECAKAAHDNHEWDMEQGYLNAIECIEEESSAQPERKKGKWIFLDECSNSGYYCSECNKKVAKEGWSNTVKKIKFCPNCGSNMRGEQDD